MDLKKIGSNTWTDLGKPTESNNALKSFLQDVHDTKILSDSRFASKATKSAPMFDVMAATAPSTSANPVTASAPTLPQLRKTGTTGDLNNNIPTASSPSRKTTKKLVPNPMRKPPPGVSYAIQERPANRAEIEALDRELEERVKVVLYRETTDLHAVESGDLYQPHKDAMLLIRDSMLEDFGVSLEVLMHEQWLDKLIKCECLRTVCDHVANVLNDMLSVSSGELGSVLRKLRFTYKQSFDQMHMSARQLHFFYVDTKQELESCRKELASVRLTLSNKDAEMQRVIEREVSFVRSDFESQRAMDQDTIAQTEHQMEQMSDTLKSLNGIFKAMQADGSAARTADLVSRAQKLEASNADLLAKLTAFEDTKIQLAMAEAQVAFLEAERVQSRAQFEDMERELQRRESVVAMLMEKDALRTAELEKMQRQEEAKRHKEAINVSAFEETPTSVLCIRCKRSLDDLSNIRAAVYGYGNSANPKKKQCEAFRSLLPNLKGRRPVRNSVWLRTCMRSILLCKMREDVSLLQIKGEISRFPHFVYAWFDQNVGGAQKLSSAELATNQALADEDRWGLYYGVKAMAKDDAEAQVFWGLLDEAHGEDGQQFLFHCLSIALSLGGAQLWYQLGWPLFQVNSIHMMNDVLELKGFYDISASQKKVVWFDVATCIAVVRMVLVRALKTQISDAVEAIEALKTVPEVDDPLVPISETDEAEDGLEKRKGRTGKAPKPKHKPVVTDPTVLHSTLHGDNQEATHINLFMWIRVMLQQLQAEQIHRGAATKLMFESAAAGALTHQKLYIKLSLSVVVSSDGGTGTQTPAEGGEGQGAVHHTGHGGHGERPLTVEYPQFQAICRTLFPSAGTHEIAAMFSQCYEEGKNRQGVTAEVFMRVADIRGMFSRSLRLSTLPVLEQHSPTPFNKVGPDIKQIGLDKIAALSPSVQPTHTQSHNQANGMTRQGLGVAQGQGQVEGQGPGQGEDDNSSLASGQTLESAVPTGAGVEMGGTEDGGEAGVTGGTGGEGEEKKEEKHDVHKPVVATITTAMRETLRVKLGSLVHRKLSAILPDIFALAAKVPEKWRAMLLDAIATAQASIGETKEKKSGVKGGSKGSDNLKASERRRNGNNPGIASAGSPSMSSHLYLDGIQPFVQYRRLLSLALLVRSLTDNPLLPTELFAAPHRHYTANLDISLRQAETLLCNLEAGLVNSAGPHADVSGLGMGPTPGGAKRHPHNHNPQHPNQQHPSSTAMVPAGHIPTTPNHGPGTAQGPRPTTALAAFPVLNLAHTHLSWTIKFEISRRKLVARKIQAVVRSFLNHASVVIPKTVRGMLRPGYLRGVRGIRTRQVIHEPWWITGQIAEIYAFKLNYDRKAYKLGLPPITLGETVSAVNYTRYGVVEVAERETHDLFYTMRIYMTALPRVRLFAAFLGVQGSGDFEGDCNPLGNSPDNDATKRERNLMDKLLQTPHALAIYLDLLVEIHREIVATKTWKELFKQKQMGAIATASVDDESKDGDAEAGDASEKAGDEEEEEGDEDEQHGGKRGSGSDHTSVLSAGESKKSGSVVVAPPVDPLHLHTVSLPQVMASVDVLFPSTTNAFERMDKRDSWWLDKDMAKRAAKRWAQSLKAQTGANPIQDNAMGAFFEDLPELLRSNTNGEVDVDDFFYLTMVQWAKLTAITIEKSTHKVAWVEKHNPSARATAAALALTSDASGEGGTSYTTTMITVKTPTSASPSSSAFTAVGHQSYHAHFLKQFVESMYFTPLPGDNPGTGGGTRSSQKTIAIGGGGGGGSAGGPSPGTGFGPMVHLSDSSSQAAMYLRMVVCRPRRPWDTSSSTDVLTGFLRETTLWDLNTGTGQAPEIPLADYTTSTTNDAPPLGSKPLPQGQGLVAISTKAPAPSSSMPIPSAPKGPQNKDAANRFYSLRSVHMAVSPEVALMAARQTFHAYHDMFSAKILQIARRQAALTTANNENPNVIVSSSSAAVMSDIDRLVSKAGLIIAEFTEKVTWVESLALTMEKKVNPAAALNPYEVHKEHEKRVMESKRCWVLLQALLCTVQELVTLSGEELPKDAWESGKKLYVERAGVFAIPLQNKVFV